MAFGLQNTTSIQGVIKFETIKVTSLNSYNKLTGIFTVPISGKELFILNRPGVAGAVLKLDVVGPLDNRPSID